MTRKREIAEAGIIETAAEATLADALEKIVALQNEYQTFYGEKEARDTGISIAETALEAHRQVRLGPDELADALEKIVGTENEYRAFFGEPDADEFGAKVLPIAAAALEVHRQRRLAPAGAGRSLPHPSSGRP